MSLANIPTYCTKTDVEHMLSQNGVKLRLDDDEDNMVNAFEDQAMTDSILDATETVNLYLFQKYTPEQLALSNWVNRRTTSLASCVLASRRGNPVPDALADRCAQAIEELEKIEEGRLLLPGVPLRISLVPKWSNVRADPRYRFKVLRVERNNSSSQPTQLPQNVDFQEAFTFEI